MLQYGGNKLLACAPSAFDWQILEIIIKILSPLKELTLKASKKGDNINIVNTIPFFEYVIFQLSEAIVTFDEDDDISQAVQAATSKITHYYDGLSVYASIAYILDPRNNLKTLKKLWKNDGWIKTTTESFRTVYERYCAKYVQVTTPISRPGSPASGDKRKASSFEDFNNSINFETVGGNDVDELSIYLDTDPIVFPDKAAAKNFNLLVYWKGNQAQFPILSRMARDIFAIQSTSVPSERVFSSAGRLVTKKRASIVGGNVEKTQFLKYNISNVYLCK
jgi:hypothetical protein